MQKGTSINKHTNSTSEHGNWPIFSTEFEKVTFGGLWKRGILFDTEILYFERRDTAKFQSYGH